MKSWARIAFLTVVAAQLVFLIGFIGIRETALFTGTEVVLQTVPVDPRSLLQGDYAILDYEIATLPGYMETRGIGETVYVKLRRSIEREAKCKRLDSSGLFDIAAAIATEKYASRAALTTGAVSTLASARISCPKGPAASSSAHRTCRWWSALTTTATP